MKSNAAMKRFAAVWLAFCMIVSSFPMITTAQAEDSRDLIFEGFTLQYGSDNKSIQALVTISVKNAYVRGVGFNLEYDPNILVPSDAETNAAITDTETEDFFGYPAQKAFIQDTDAFPKGTNTEGAYNFLVDEMSYVHDSNQLTMTLTVNNEQDAQGLIVKKTYRSGGNDISVNCINADNSTVTLGQVSFRVKNTVELFNMTTEQLQNILKITPAPLYEVNSGAQLMYIDTGEDTEEFDWSNPVTWKIDNTNPKSTKARVPESTLSSYSIYNRCNDNDKKGTVEDLFAYLNQKMGYVVMEYPDGRTEVNRIMWNSDPKVSIVEYSDGKSDYDPLGGITYTVTQYFGYGTDDGEDIRTLTDEAKEELEGYKVTVIVHVTPVTLVRFDYERRIMSWPAASRPATWPDLQLPNEIVPVLDGVDDLYVPPVDTPDNTVDDGSVWSPRLSGINILTDTATVSQTFDYTVPTTLFDGDTLTWLTLQAEGDPIWKVDAIRNVLADVTGMPDPTKHDSDEVTAVVQPDGKLVITVHSIGGETTLPSGTNFKLYFPDGTVLDTTNSTSGSDYEKLIKADGMVITVDALYSDADADTSTSNDPYTLARRQAMQWLINPGSNDFKLSALLDYGGGTIIETPQIDFEFSQRRNDYLADSTSGAGYVDASGNPFIYDIPSKLDNGTVKYIVKDYAGFNAALFPVYEGQSIEDISTYVSFPAVNDTIPVTYNAQTGTQWGNLRSAKVIEWDHWEDSSGSHASADVLPEAGTDVTLIGKLQDYTYSGFGKVTNSYDMWLKLNLTTLSDTSSGGPTPSPEATDNPDASPEPTETPLPPGVTPAPTATPQPKEGLLIKTRVPKSDAGTYVVLNDKTFEYDTKKVGYTDAQNQQYLLENVGTNKISDLTVRIADFTFTPAEGVTDSVKEAFIIGDNEIYTVDGDGVILPSIIALDSEKSAYMDIRTSAKLPCGVYEADVIVGSSHKDNLASFKIRFKVVDKDVYTVTVNNENNKNKDGDYIGLGYLMSEDKSTFCSNTYAAGDTVSLNVELLDDGYMFYNWISDNDITFDDDKKEAATFTMISENVTVEPVFKPSLYVHLRLADLRDYSVGKEAKNNLLDTKAPYGQVTFSETMYEYRVNVADDLEDNYVEFDLKDVLLKPGTTPAPMTVKMTLSNSENTDTDLNPSPQPKTDASSEVTTYLSDTFKVLAGEENTVTITTYYKDSEGNEYTLSYILRIFRKSSVKVNKLPGNSPWGLIAASDNIPAADKEAVQKKFKTDRMYDEEKTPDLAVNTMHTRYSKEAWMYLDSGGTYKYDEDNDYDCDQSALFVYNKTSFVDPGFTDLESVSNPSATISPTDVKLTIKGVYVYPDSSDLKLGDIVDPSPKTTDIPVAATPNADGKCLVEEIKDSKIRPGAYSLEYSFTDLDGEKVTFSKNLIILPEKGDMNLDGSLDSKDYDMIYQRLNNTYYTPAPAATSAPTATPDASAPTPEAGETAAPAATQFPLPYTRTDVNSDTKYNDSLYADVLRGSSLWSQLYAYRVGDVTEDINVNSIDANAILRAADITKRQYYEPLPATLTDVMSTFEPATDTTHPTAEPVPSSTPKPVLVLDYLGNGAAPEESPQPNYLSADSDVYVPGDLTSMAGLVWVGVGIRNVPNLEYFLDGLYSMDFAIDYDPSILVPCDQYLYLPTESGFNLKQTIETFNLKPSNPADPNEKAHWANASLYAESLQTHVDLDTSDRYKTEFVTIKSNDGTNLRLSGVPSGDMGTYYLLRVPFAIINWPDENYTGSAITLDLAGPYTDPATSSLTLEGQTFVMGATENGVTRSASWEGVTDKTTAVNNAKNHFDVEIVDLFNTNETFKLKGKLRGWNPQQPFTVEFFKINNSNGSIEAYESPFKSTETDDKTGEYKYGPTLFRADGSVEWEFELPLSSRFSYLMEVSKMSHVMYQDILSKDNISNGEYSEELDIDMIVGDVNKDGYVKVPDREGIMRFFNGQKPWELYRALFEEADLNGDDLVNNFDLNLWKKNMDRTYPSPTPTADTGEGGGS